MWSLYLTNLDPALTDDELTDFFRSKDFGSDVFSAQVVSDKETGDGKGIGFVHYTSAQAYKNALDEYDQVEIKGRLAKSFPAEEKKKLYVRGLPKELAEDQIKEELKSIGGPYEEISVRGGETL